LLFNERQKDGGFRSEWRSRSRGRATIIYDKKKLPFNKRKRVAESFQHKKKRKNKKKNNSTVFVYLAHSPAFDLLTYIYTHMHTNRDTRKHTHTHTQMWTYVHTCALRAGRRERDKERRRE
jgi:mRNA deadenylase 3'-5' endonuclease subunit Ccr4